MNKQAKVVIILAAILIIIAAAYLIYSRNIKSSPISKLNKILHADVPAYCQESPNLKDPHGRNWVGDENNYVGKMPTTNISVKLAQVNQMPATRPDLGLTELREFDVLLERPDYGMKESECVTAEGDIYSSDLSARLQPKRIYWDYENAVRTSGNTCNTAVFPHRCSISGALTEKPVDVWIKVVFQDDTYAEQKISVPFGGKLAEPVISSPKAAPKSDDNFKMEFADVGADNYAVAVSLCEKYGGRGINPCLDGWNFSIGKKDGKYAVLETLPPGLEIELKTDNGVISLSANQPLPYEDYHVSVGLSVIASKEGTAGENVPTYLESRYSVDLPITK